MNKKILFILIFNVLFITFYYSLTLVKANTEKNEIDIIVSYDIKYIETIYEDGKVKEKKYLGKDEYEKKVKIEKEKNKKEENEDNYLISPNGVILCPPDCPTEPGEPEPEPTPELFVDSNYKYTTVNCTDFSYTKCTGVSTRSYSYTTHKTTVYINPNSYTGHAKTVLTWDTPPQNREDELISISWDGDIINLNEAMNGNEISARQEAWYEYYYDKSQWGQYIDTYGPYNKIDPINYSLNDDTAKNIYKYDDGVIVRMNLIDDSIESRTCDGYSKYSGYGCIYTKDIYKYVITLNVNFILQTGVWHYDDGDPTNNLNQFSIYADYLHSYNKLVFDVQPSINWSFKNGFDAGITVEPSILTVWDGYNEYGENDRVNRVTFNLYN